MSHHRMHNGSFLYNSVENRYELVWKFFKVTAEVAFIIGKQCYNAEVLYPHSPAVQSSSTQLWTGNFKPSKQEVSGVNAKIQRPLSKINLLIDSTTND